MSTTGMIMTSICFAPTVKSNNDLVYPSTLSKTALTIARKELSEDANTKEEALRELRQWVEKHPQLINCRTDDNFLLRFLRVKKFNVAMAEHNLVKYLNFRQSLQHLCFSLDHKERKVARLFHEGYIFASPIRDSAGRRVVIAVAAKLNASKYTRVEMAKAHAITYETLLEDEENQVMGLTHFGDTKGVAMGHIALWPPVELATCLRIGEQAVPLRHKEIHIINIPNAFRFVYDFANSRMSEKMRNRVKVHNSITELHEHLDRKCLPKEYGGTIPMVDMVEMWKKELAGSRDHLLKLDNMKSLVPIRRRNTNVSEMTGSFKKLEVD